MLDKTEPGICPAFFVPTPGAAGKAATACEQ